MIIVKTQIKEAVKQSGMDIDNVSADFIDKLDNKVIEVIKQSCRRAKENGRKTVMAKDL